MQWLGKLAVIATPLLLVGTVVLGLVAATTYNGGADQYIKPCAPPSPHRAFFSLGLASDPDQTALRLEGR